MKSIWHLVTKIPKVCKIYEPQEITSRCVSGAPCSNESPRGVTALVCKAKRDQLLDRKQFQEPGVDLNSTVSPYRTMAAMCEVSGDDMLKVILVMLFGDTLLYYSTHVKHCTSYEEAIGALR